MYFSQVWRLEVQEQDFSMVGLRAVFQVADFSSYPHIVEGRGEGFLWGLFYKSANTIHEGSTLISEAPPKGSTF